MNKSARVAHILMDPDAVPVIEVYQEFVKYAWYICPGCRHTQWIRELPLEPGAQITCGNCELSSKPFVVEYGSEEQLPG